MARRRVHLLSGEQGSSLLEFAIVLPLLVVFVVGIYDFSGAFNEKQKIEQAAQEGAILAGSQPMTDIAASSSATPTNPSSLLAVVDAVFDSLAASGVLPNANQGSCVPPTAPTGQAALTWTYTIGGCSSGGVTSGDNLVIIINRGWMSSAVTPAAVGSTVTVQYPYHWQFGKAIQLLFPGPNSYSTPTTLTESATVHNQM
jgi:Flp pilus assembly protein TadG